MLRSRNQVDKVKRAKRRAEKGREGREKKRQSKDEQDKDDEMMIRQRDRGEEMESMKKRNMEHRKQVEPSR